MSSLLSGRPALLLATSALACSGSAPPPATPAAPVEAVEPPGPQVAGPDPLAAVDWMIGRWESGDAAAPAAEHWGRVGDLLHGVGFSISGGTSSFEVMTISGRDGRLVFTGMPSGLVSVDFQAKTVREDGVVFANPMHDFPQAIRYGRQGDHLSAVVSGQGSADQEFHWRLGSSKRVAELENADRAFAAEVADRRIDGWVDWFDPAAGAMWTQKRSKGRDAIRAAMAPGFARPDYRLEWTPFSSGLSPVRDLGYTTGAWKASWSGGGATRSCGSYVTIWRRQTDGGWRALFYRAWTGVCGADGNLMSQQPVNPA